MPFLHFTVAVEYSGRMTADQQQKLLEEIEKSLIRHADTVAVGRAFDKYTRPSTKAKVLPIDELPLMRNVYGAHQHDNDAACTPCVRLYEYVHPETL